MRNAFTPRPFNFTYCLAQCSLYLNGFLKCRVDIFPDEIEFGLHILDVCCGHYYGILFRNDKDVLTVCTVCPE